MEFVGKLKGMTRNIITKDYEITFVTTEAPESAKFKTDDILLVKASKNRKRRSLDSNSYCWLLIGKIADVVKASKEEIYEQMLVRYGQPFISENGGAQMITVRDGIDVHPFGIYTKLIGSGHVDGKLFNHYVVFRGSSDYDTKEMSVFIDGIVSEAKELGIDTMPLVDIERMKLKWHI